MAVSLAFEQAAGDPVMGIDEAGRGPLAGGVYAAAVSVPLARAAELLAGAWAAVNDSKRLSAKLRPGALAIARTVLMLALLALSLLWLVNNTFQGFVYFKF